jgi:hypothetical protein
MQIPHARCLLTKAASAAATAQHRSLINLLLPATHHLWDTLFSVKENMVEYLCALNHICCCSENLSVVSSVAKSRKFRAISFVQLQPCVCCFLVQWSHTFWACFFGGLGYHKKKEGRTQRRAIGSLQATEGQCFYFRDWVCEEEEKNSHPLHNLMPGILCQR